MTIIKNLVDKFFLLVILFLPTQLGYHFWPDFSLVYGTRVDYLAPTVFLTDILVGVYLFLNFPKITSFVKENLAVFLGMGVLLLINVILSTNKNLSALHAIKILEVVFFGVTVYINSVKTSINNVIKVLLFSSAIVSLLGIYNFLNGSTTGLFYLLGERTFSMNTPGIALTSLGGSDFLRAYSIFSHPNSLAGYLSLVVIFVFLNRGKFQKIYYLFSFLIFVCLILTFSVSAGLGFVFLIALNFYVSHTKVKLANSFVFIVFLISILFALVSKDLYLNLQYLSKNFLERFDLAYISLEIFKINWFSGSGLNTFIPESVKVNGIMGRFWLLQPVHNIYLLILSETGVVGFLFSFVIVAKSFLIKNKAFVGILLFVMVTGLFDHYWLTLQQNNLLLALLLGLTYKK